MCLTLKVVCHKPYEDFKLLLILIYQLKDLLIDFVISLSVLINLNSESYNLISVIIHRLINIIYYKVINITIDVSSLAKVIINIVIYHFRDSELIVKD